MKVNLKDILIGTALSILVFFSISFIYVLTSIGANQTDPFSLEIGFPYSYYNGFLLGSNDYLNFGWVLKNLFIDCFLTWIVVCGLYFNLKKSK